MSIFNLNPLLHGLLHNYQSVGQQQMFEAQQAAAEQQARFQVALAQAQRDAAGKPDCQGVTIDGECEEIEPPKLLPPPANGQAGP